MSCHFKLCSRTMDRSSMWRFKGIRTAFSCIGYPMACTIARPHSPGFLPMGVIQETCIEKSPMQNTSGCNRDHMSQDVAPSYVAICETFYENVFQIKEAAFSMLYVCVCVYIYIYIIKINNKLLKKCAFHFITFFFCVDYYRVSKSVSRPCITLYKHCGTEDYAFGLFRL